MSPRVNLAIRRRLVLGGLALFLCQLQSAGGVAADPAFVPGERKADFTARQVTNMLHKAAAGERLDFSGRNLTYLDLAGIDFKSANLAHSNLYGTDLTGAKLAGADLSGTRLDRAVLIRADLSGATLSGATIFRPTVYSDLSTNLADAPHFNGARLDRIRVQAELSGADFRGAEMTRADFSPLEARPGSGTLTTMYRNILRSCDFSGARLERANFDRAILTFTRFTGATLVNANFEKADLSRVDFSGADVTGADFTGADFDGAVLTGVKGLDTATGLDTAVNLDKAVR